MLASLRGANSRLVSADANTVAFRYKDYRAEHQHRWKTMRLETGEFIRRFLSHVLPSGFHRIRHYGLFANGNRTGNIARLRELLAVPEPSSKTDDADNAEDQRSLELPCPCCGGRMIIIAAFASWQTPRHRPQPEAIDSS